MTTVEKLVYLIRRGVINIEQVAKQYRQEVLTGLENEKTED